MTAIKGEKTKENLLNAFAGESQARNKYTYFAKVATKQGYHYIAKIFEETAENEVQHAKEEFKLLNGIGDTADNLKAKLAKMNTSPMTTPIESCSPAPYRKTVLRLSKLVEPLKP